jgi:hypothetical protein
MRPLARPNLPLVRENLKHREFGFAWTSLDELNYNAVTGFLQLGFWGWQKMLNGGKWIGSKEGNGRDGWRR